MAEIDRRSNIIFQKRKQQKRRILIVCVPAVLCATLFFTIILPAITPSVSENHSISPEQIEKDPNCSVTKIEISGHNLSLSYTETADILMIQNQLNACTATPPDASSIFYDSNGDDFSESSITANSAQHITSTSSASAYTIMLHQQDGIIKAYSLTENVLKNLSSNETYALSPEQAKELKLLLAIPQNE